MVTDVIVIAAAAYLIITGLITLFTGKTVGLKMDGYTKDSIEKFARPCGGITTLLGASVLVFALGLRGTLSSTFTFVGLGAIVVFCVIYIFVMKKILVKTN